METDSAFANRLKKNARHFRKWARREGLTAYRLYDRDIPEHPFAVDWYDGRVQLSEFPRPRAVRSGEAEAARRAAIDAIAEVLEVPRPRIHAKLHLPKKWGQEQYQREERQGERFTVEEQGLKFWVQLEGRLDTGLFLDHRLTRARVRAEATGKRFLNLFAYTGAFTVYAAAGGARSTTSVDLSKTYLDWAEDNLALNALASPRHALLRADVVQWLKRAEQEVDRFDLIVLDPPPFSTSKRMGGAFDIQRDHPSLLVQSMALLARGGALYFSTNYRGFELQLPPATRWSVEEITAATVPEDFRRGAPHRCWRLSQPHR